PAGRERMPVQVALLTPERIETKPAAAPPKPAPARARKPVASPPREHVLTALQPATQAAPPAVAASGPAASEAAATPGPDANAAASAGTTAAASVEWREVFSAAIRRIAVRHVLQRRAQRARHDSLEQQRAKLRNDRLGSRAF